MRMATCTLALAALVVCGWIVTGQQDDEDEAALRAALKQMADALEQNDAEALIDFICDQTLFVDGFRGGAHVLDKGQALEVLAGAGVIELEDWNFEGALLGQAASARGQAKAHVLGQTYEVKAEMLFLKEGGGWALRAAAFGPPPE